MNALKNKIGNLPHIQGGTRTDRALELAGEDFFGWVESGDRPEKPNVLIVLTDGDTNEGSRPFPEVLPPLEVLTLLVEVYFEKQSRSLFINLSLGQNEQNHSNENALDLRETSNELRSKAHFHMKGFAL